MMPSTRVRILLTAAFALISVGRCSGFTPQSFSVSPVNVSVHEGSEALLQCQVANLAGQVQWVKDGLALGYEATIPGSPRYSMIGDRSSGVFNLRIINASLDDDADFECQVSPAKGHKAIRSGAKLTVIAPPTEVEIVGHPRNSKIEVNENQSLTLECVAYNAKPPPTIVWYRNKVELQGLLEYQNNVALTNRVDSVAGVEQNQIANEVPDASHAKRYNVKSRITLSPSKEDDYTDYTCEARHEALAKEYPLRTAVQLSVLYPPGEPHIEGYTEGETIRRGQQVELSCRSRGGNPPAQLVWYRNDLQVNMMYHSKGRYSENFYKFTAKASDNGARFRCEASNVRSVKPLKAEVKLTVFFAPAQVTISGPTEGKVGDTLHLTCITANSNPPAEIMWAVNGKKRLNVPSIKLDSPDGGSITSSNLSVTIPTGGQRSLAVVCHGNNQHLSETILRTHSINILYPPGEPLIVGYHPDSYVTAGSTKKLSCRSEGGHPLATLTWYKNDKKIPSTAKEVNKTMISEITVAINQTDNEARYKCEASNAATEVPLVDTVTMHVYYPPEHVVIRQDPPKLKPGQKATLTCESSASNPPAVITWWRAGIPISTAPGDITNATGPGLYGGKTSTSTLSINVAPDSDGLTYTCQATNTQMRIDVNQMMKLNIVYKPVFDGEPTSGIRQVTAIEGEQGQLAISPRGNPPDLKLTWFKDNLPYRASPLVTVSQSTLNFSTVKREDAGIYALDASNSEGTSSVKVQFIVKFSPKITSVPRVVIVADKEDATLTCSADGEPLAMEHFTWKRAGFNVKERATVTYANGTSFLRIHAPTKEDMGQYECIVNNGIGAVAKANATMLIKHKPEFDISPEISKAAANSGNEARLVCRAKGAPQVNFEWRKGNSNINGNTSDRYITAVNKLDELTYESILVIKAVKQNDFGTYDCVAKNSMGPAVHNIKLEITSRPDPPISISIMNITHDSITVSWVPGFNGGLPQAFRLNFRRVGTEASHTVDVTPSNSTRYIIRGLHLGTEYEITVKAKNRLGESPYLQNPVRGMTLRESPSAEHERRLQEVLREQGALPRLVITAVASTAAVLVFVNILVVICVLRHRQSKKQRKPSGASEQGSNKSGNIEMYAPSSFNETVTGETLSSISEKSETYSGEAVEEFIEQGSKRAASTYLIDQVEPPAQYAGYMHPGSRQSTLTRQHKPVAPNQELDQEAVYVDSLRRNAYNHSIGEHKGYHPAPPPEMDPSAYYPQERYYPPPPGPFSRPPLSNGMAHRHVVPPPDVTMLVHAANGPVVPRVPPKVPSTPTSHLTTFTPHQAAEGRSLETEGHLV
ncbi:nephrin isoform X2 [Neocloeon triangulifer]|uniref:nephrin isoform X2 n=1 Tax=Neocloeon triangulifer TaxID=2078957 RepID=UPI00286F08C1|nr:nephrin isoform X2 [Neocloeon triangulifer]